METSKVITYFIKVSPIDLFEFLRTYKDDRGFYKDINWLTRYIADLLVYGCRPKRHTADSMIWSMRFIHPENLISFMAHDYKKESWAKISDDWCTFLKRNVPEGGKGEFSVEFDDSRDIYEYLVQHFEVPKINDEEDYK